MKKLIVLTTAILLLTGCQNDRKLSTDENEEQVKVTNKITPLADIKKNADKNKDGQIDGKDWLKLSRPQKYKLVNYYINKTYRSLGIKPPKDEKDKEIRRMVTRLNSYYSDNFLTKSAYFPVHNRETSVYDAMLAVK